MLIFSSFLLYVNKNSCKSYVKLNKNYNKKTKYTLFVHIFFIFIFHMIENEDSYLD